MPIRYLKFCALTGFFWFSIQVDAGPREQASRIHDRLVGVPAETTVLNSMQDLIADSNAEGAALLAMQQADFYRTTLKNFATPWTNRDGDIFAPLNDYSATIIGMVRDNADFREILTGDYLYVGAASTGVPVYSTTSNSHYEALEQGGFDLAEVLERRNQADLVAIPATATAGINTSRAAARAFLKAGTNRAMLRFTLLNQLCVELEEIKDITRSPSRVRQDVTRSPGGDSRIYRNNCVGCHAGMDPLIQAFAYYDYEYDVDNDPDGINGRLTYNREGDIDPTTGSRVVSKYHNNENNFPFGFVTPDDRWDNYWREGRNQLLGWDMSLPGSGIGAKSMGQELANTSAFAQCQVKKVFKEVCLRNPENAQDRNQIDAMTDSFTASGYQLRQPFADAAVYCMGD